MQTITIKVPDDCEVQVVKKEKSDKKEESDKPYVPDVCDDVNDIYDSMGL